MFVGTSNPFVSLKVCDTPQIYVDIGCERLPMLYSRSHLKKAVSKFNNKTHAHGLSADDIKAMPELLEKPVMIFDSLTRNDSIVAVSDRFDKNNDPIIASIKPNGKGRCSVTIDVRPNLKKIIEKVIEIC